MKKIQDGSLGEIVLFCGPSGTTARSGSSASADGRPRWTSDAQLVSLRLALRRPHLRATRPQPRRRAIGSRAIILSRPRAGQLPLPQQSQGPGQIYDNHFVEFTYGTARRCSASAVSSRRPERRVRNSSTATRASKELPGTREPPLSAGARPLGQRRPSVREAQRRLARRHQHDDGHPGPHGDLLRPDRELGRSRGRGPRRDARDLAFDADPPAMPDENGLYDHAAPVPGEYKPF